MKLSYCTTCHDRLWQLQQTLDHNLAFTKVGEVELVIVFFNDHKASNIVAADFDEYIVDGRLRIVSYSEDIVFQDGSFWSCGYVKDIAHNAGIGDVLFNLDADNFIDEHLHQMLLKLKPDEVVITCQKEFKADGRSGRIGVHKDLYGRVRYQDKGKNDDADFLQQCIKRRVKFRQSRCEHPPISNARP